MMMSRKYIITLQWIWKADTGTESGGLRGSPLFVCVKRQTEAALPAAAAGSHYQRKKNPGVPSGANSRPKFLRWVFSTQLLSSTLKRPDIGQ